MQTDDIATILVTKIFVKSRDWLLVKYNTIRKRKSTHQALPCPYIDSFRVGPTCLLVPWFSFRRYLSCHLLTRNLHTEHQLDIIQLKLYLRRSVRVIKSCKFLALSYWMVRSSCSLTRSLPTMSPRCRCGRALWVYAVEPLMPDRSKVRFQTKRDTKFYTVADLT